MGEGGFNISGIEGSNITIGDAAAGNIIKDNVGNVVVGDSNVLSGDVTQTSGISAAEMAELMSSWTSEMEAKIDALPDFDDDEKKEVKATVAKIEAETVKIAKAKEAAAADKPAKPEGGEAAAKIAAAKIADAPKADAPKKEVSTNRLERLINTLVVMAPDIFEVATTTLTNPLGGIGLVLKKISNRVKLEQASASA